jgi:uncharacterized repeat protein (TIGR01451 family)
LLTSVALVILGLAVALRPEASRAEAEDLSPAESWSVTILESDAHHLLLELELAAFESETVEHAGVAYQRLRVADWGHWGQPGQPGLPMHALALGMPRPGTPRISIVAAESETMKGYRLLPVPTLALEETEDTPQVVEIYASDGGAYSADTFYPGPLAEAVESGLLRDQPIFQLRLYPLQYNPRRGELQVYRWLRVLVNYPEAEQAPGEARLREPSPIFERILAGSLLNYDALPRPVLAPGGATTAPLTVLDDGPQVKLKVEAAGLYRVTHSDLQAVAPALLQRDPRHLELSNRGVAVPILFEGQADGSFDPGDSFIFYGQAIASEYTRQNVYWLRDRGAAALRMTQRDGTPGTGSTPGAFADQRRYEQDNLYWQNRPDGDGKDHWFWSRLSVGGATPVAEEYTFDLRHLAGSGPAGEVRLALHGVTTGDHLTQVYLNGVALLSEAERAWVGPVEKVYRIPASQSLFVEGTNRLRVESILPAGSVVSTIYVNWFEVTYQDTYVAEENLLRFGAPAAGTYQFQVTDFTSSALGLFDITDPAAPVHITNYVVEAQGAGYRLRFSDSAGPTQAYLAQRDDQLPRPTLELDQPTTWRSPGNGATYVIVTHPSFYDAVQPLATHRRNQGETVVTVRTVDLYDEFYYGIYDAQAIRSFLEYAYANWSPRPVYVLLMGDASSDPKNNRGSSLSDLLPAHYVDTPLFGQTPNDSWYTNVHGNDDYPDLIVGRIPARSAGEVATVVNKVQVYESSPPAGNWVRRAVLVADDGEAAFTEDMDSVADMMPAQMNPIKMYAYDPSTSVPDRVNGGTLLLAYSGHGYLRGWASWSGDPDQIFNHLQVQGLANGNRLPFMTVANCLNGYFADYYRARSMAEEFLLVDNKGGIGSWASAAYGYPTSNTVIQEALFHALLVDGDRVLGSAATTARIQAHSTRPDLPLSLFETFTYFGDPAVRLSVPARLDVEGQDAPDPVVMGEELTYSLSYTVSGADQARGLTLVDTLPQGVTYESASPAPSSVYARTLTWNLGDTPAGSYTVTVVARVGTSGLAHGQTLSNQAHLYDANGGDGVVAIATTVHDRPIAGLSAINDSPTWLGYPTTLSAATTSGTNVVYTWDFGDGSPTRTGASVQHTYPAVDSYTAQVTASNGVGSQSQTTVVTVTDVPPSTSFFSSSPDRIGQITTLESTSGGTNLTYGWDFGDGSPVASTQELTIDHVYGSVGSYQVVLTATNSAGTDVATGVVEILEQPKPPVASFISSSPDELGQATRFTNTSQDGGDDAENISYTWDFGDEGSSTAKHPTHSYAGAGIYQVTLTINNSVGSDTFSAPVVVTDVPIRGLAIQQDGPTFLGSATHLAASIDAGTNVSYQWDLGDGSSGGGPSLAHTYGAPGSYTVVLTATNSMNQQVVTDTVVIEEQQIEGLALAHDGPTLLGHPTAFSATVSAGTSVVYRWDLGDGATSSLQNPAHTYGAIGEYTVVLTATNSWGSQHRADTVVVQDEPISGLRVSHDGPTTLGMPTTLNATVASGTNVVYSWDLGDGQAASGAHLTHTYGAPGVYELTVTAINGTSAEEVSTTVSVVEQWSVFFPLVLRP